MHLNSFPGLDKLNWLKDSHPSVGCTYKGVSWHNQADRDCDSLLYLNLCNQVSKPLERRPGCYSVKKADVSSKQATEHLRLLSACFPQASPQTGLWPSSHWSPQRRPTSFRSWMAPSAWPSEMLSTVPQLQASCPCSPKPPGLLHSPQLSRMTSASPGANTAAQIRCHHSHRGWLPLSPGTLTSPSQPAARACRILCPHFLS